MVGGGDGAWCGVRSVAEPVEEREGGVIGASVQNRLCAIRKYRMRPENETEKTVHLQRASWGPLQAMDDGRRGMFVHGVGLWRAYDAGPRYGEGRRRREGWAKGVLNRGIK